MELPQRKKTRLEGFDYASCGAYFITICTQDRACTLWAVRDGSPVPKLSGAGEIVDRYIRSIPHRYDNASVDKYVIMPNHVHLILSLHSIDGTGNLGTGNLGTGNPSPTVGAIVGWLKYQATKGMNMRDDTVSMRRFQRSYYDHIIRNEQEYLEIWEYIDENPRKWADDPLYIP